MGQYPGRRRQGRILHPGAYSEIVNFAKERYITIVPEIDMPGHTNAVLASYAELIAQEKLPSYIPGQMSDSVLSAQLRI